MNDPLNSAEAFYDINGEWTTMTALRSIGGMGSLNVIRQRLTFIGGRGNQGATSSIHVYNHQTGWHLTNLLMTTAKSGHVSQVAKVGQISHGRQASLRDVLELR